MLRDLAVGAAVWAALCIAIVTIHHVMRRRLNARKPTETNNTEGK